jgi:hypothetical protein
MPSLAPTVVSKPCAGVTCNTWARPGYSTFFNASARPEEPNANDQESVITTGVVIVTQQAMEISAFRFLKALSEGNATRWIRFYDPHTRRLLAKYSVSETCGQGQWVNVPLSPPFITAKLTSYLLVLDSVTYTPLSRNYFEDAYLHTVKGLTMITGGYEYGIKTIPDLKAVPSWNLWLDGKAHRG